MPLTLPTDTAAIRLDTKQYELLGKRLGHGVPRRTLLVGVVVAIPWLVLMLLVGVPLWSSLGPAAYAVPPFWVTYQGLRRDTSGRFTLIRWYDQVLALRRRRRRPVRNPFVSAARFEPRFPVTVNAVTLVRSQPGVR